MSLAIGLGRECRGNDLAPLHALESAQAAFKLTSLSFQHQLAPACRNLKSVSYLRSFYVRAAWRPRWPGQGPRQRQGWARRQGPTPGQAVSKGLPLGERAREDSAADHYPGTQHAGQCACANGASLLACLLACALDCGALATGCSIQLTATCPCTSPRERQLLAQSRVLLAYVV